MIGNYWTVITKNPYETEYVVSVWQNFDRALLTKQYADSWGYDTYMIKTNEIHSVNQEDDIEFIYEILDRVMNDDEEEERKEELKDIDIENLIDGNKRLEDLMKGQK